MNESSNLTTSRIYEKPLVRDLGKLLDTTKGLGKFSSAGRGKSDPMIAVMGSGERQQF